MGTSKQKYLKNILTAFNRHFWVPLTSMVRVGGKHCYRCPSYSSQIKKKYWWKAFIEWFNSPKNYLFHISLPFPGLLKLLKNCSQRKFKICFKRNLKLSLILFKLKINNHWKNIFFRTFVDCFTLGNIFFLFCDCSFINTCLIFSVMKTQTI